MDHRTTALSVIWLCVSAAGCLGEPVDQQARCADLDARFESCFGDDVPPLVCAGMTDRDIARLTIALDGALCDRLIDAIPQDGDVRSTYCRLFGEGCITATNAPPILAPTRYPILLVNGIDLSPNFRWSARIVETMRVAGGHDVYLAIDRPYDLPERRAHDLWATVQEIREITGSPKVNLICHSLGGLDCRYLVSPAGLHWEVPASHADIVDAVASVTMVGTAHRGTRAADAVLGYLPDADGGQAIEAMATFLGDWFTDAALTGDTHLVAAMGSLSRSAMLAFNADVIDADGVYYQSWAGFSRPRGAADPAYDRALLAACAASDDEDGLALFSGDHDYLHVSLAPLALITGATEDDAGEVGTDEAPNDGLVTVESARWGKFRGCLPADHMEQLGQRNLPDVNVRTGLDVAWFYAAIAADLAARGF